MEIGTGASCILPLLGNFVYGWEMVASEANLTAYASALKNRARIRSERIDVRKVDLSAAPLEFLRAADGNFCGLVCNPPFYEDEASMSVNMQPGCSVMIHEGTTEGGEVGFLKKIAESSKLVENSICVLTSMLGHKASVEEISNYLKLQGASFILCTRFFQGRTIRYGVAWSWDICHLPARFQDVLLDLRTHTRRSRRTT